jgi:hypothetical protein
MNAKVTLVDSPRAQVLAKAAVEVTVTDARGRQIILKKPGVLAQYRIIEVAGGEAAKNEVWMSIVVPLIFVTSIDGDLIVQPTSRLQLDALIQRLDEDGLDAVMKGVKANFLVGDPEVDKAAIKK